MQANTANYVRLSHTVKDPGLLIPVTDLDDPAKLRSHLAKAPNDDWYVSLFQFGQDAKDYFDKNNKSINGYTGSAFTNRLVFDFDSKVDLDIARQDAIKLLGMLQSSGVDVVDSTRVFFSGSKGFHVELFTSRSFTPDETKELVTHIKEVLNLTSLDTVIYNTTRLYRIFNTKHNKTGLYKIELEPKELADLTVEQIKEKAKNIVDLTFVPTPTNNLTFIDTYKVLFQKKPKVVVDSQEIDGIRGLDLINFDNCPKTVPRCIYALSQGAIPTGQGTRNQYFLRLASYYAGQGYNKEVLLKTLEGIAEANAKLYPDHDPYTKEELKQTVVTSVSKSKAFKVIPGASGFSDDNKEMADYCKSLDSVTHKKCCKHHKVLDMVSAVVQIDQVSDSFGKFATDFDKNTVKTGIQFIDDNMNIAVGTTTLLVGATGSGKTTVALNMMENANALDQHTMFFSLDMHKNLIYLKLAQKLTNYSQEQIFNFFKNKNIAKQNEIMAAIKNRYGKTFFDFSSTLTMDQMRDKVLKVEEEQNIKIKLVVVDYAGRVTGPYSDTFANANYNALKSTEVANITEAAWIFISQISRNIGDGVTPIRTKRAAKDSGTWEESSTNVITVWRPFMTDNTRDDVMRIFLAKNRMGKEVEEVLHFDGQKGQVRDMSFEERADYSAIREQEEKEFLKARFSKS